MDPETLNIHILAIVSARPGWLALTVCLAEGVAGCARQRRQGKVVKWYLFLPYTYYYYHSYYYYYYHY